MRWPVREHESALCESERWPAIKYPPSALLHGSELWPRGHGLFKFGHGHGSDLVRDGKAVRGTTDDRSRGGIERAQ